MRKLLVLVVFSGLMMSASIAVVDPNLPNIPAHRHFVQNGSGLVQVGPRLCDDARVQRAFDQYHSNVYVHVDGAPGPNPSAPGLQDGRGAEITARPCSFAP